MKITKRQLRRIIKETLLREVDTDVYEGDHDPIRVEIPALVIFATEKSFEGKKEWFSDSDAISLAEILEEEKPSIESFSYNEKEWQEALDKWNEVHDHLESWDSSDKEELAKNIHNQIENTKDSGYGY